MDFVVIPEGCYFQMSDSCYETLHSKNADLMKKMNLSSIALYFNKTARYENTIIALEDLLGLEIDYYEVFNEEEYIKLINLITPLSYDVKTNLSYINRKGVSVEIPAGTQFISGESALAIMKAEESYSSKVNHVNEICGYLDKYYSFIFSLNSADKLKEYYTYVFEIMQTDAVYDDYLPYLDGLYNVNPNEIGFNIIIGQYAEDGRYFMDVAQMQEMVQKIKERPAGAGKDVVTTQAPSTSDTEEGSSEAETEDGTTTEVSENPQGTNTKDATIQIMNSTNVNGLAKKWQNKLNENGFNVTQVTNYKGNGALESTKILVKDLTLGSELKEYFPSATIETGDVPNGFDIVIILSSQDKVVN